MLLGMGVWMTACGDTGGSGSGCDSGEVECDGVCIPEITPTLEGAQGIQASVFDGSCAFSGCHGSMGAAQAGLELSSASVSAANLIDVQSTEVVGKLRVAPGDTNGSYLVDKLLGINLAGTARMPNAALPLCDVKITAVEDWVAAGAN